MGKYLERIAIVGAGGQVGTPITKSLLQTGKHTVTALTRQGSSSELPHGVKTVIVNYEDEETIVEALKDQQFLIISLTQAAVKDVEPKLIRAAAKAGVSYVMPNWYGLDLADEKFAQEILVSAGAQAAIKQIQDAGMKSVVLTCGFWYGFSLVGGVNGRGGGTNRYGFDLKNRKVVLFDDGTQRINTSTLEQCGRTMASLLSLPEDSNAESSDHPALDRWANKIVYCSSFTISQMDMFDSVKRVTNTTDADWNITKENSKERYEEAKGCWQNGDITGLIRAGYTRVFFQDGLGNFGATRGLDNGVLGLPEENLDECTKSAISESM